MKNQSGSTIHSEHGLNINPHKKTDMTLDVAEFEFKNYLNSLSTGFLNEHLGLQIDQMMLATKAIPLCNKLITQGGLEIEDPISTIINELLLESSTGSTYSLIGYAGGGRELVICIIYIELCRKLKNLGSNILPVIIDRRLETKAGYEIPHQMSSAIAQLERHESGKSMSQRKYIALIVGRKKTDLDPERQPVQDFISQLISCITKNCDSILSAKASGLRNNEKRGTNNAINHYEIEERKFGENCLNSLIQLAALSNSAQIDQLNLDNVNNAIRQICRRHRTFPDLFLAKLVIAAITNESDAPTSLGGLLEDYVESFLNRRYETLEIQEKITQTNHSWMMSRMELFSKGQYLFDAKKSQKKTKAKRDLIIERDNLKLDVDTGFFELVRTHHSIRDWLTAREFCQMLESFSLNETHITEPQHVISKYNHVFPSRITAFMRDYIDYGKVGTSRSVVIAIRNIFRIWQKSDQRNKSDGGLNISYRKFATTCVYIAGRIQDPSAKKEMGDLLKSLAELVKMDLIDFNRINGIISSASQAHSFSIRKWAKNVFVALGVEIPSSPDEYPKTLTRIEREITLLQRGIYISRAMLGSQNAAEQYISDLLTNYTHDDLNRGFHREYYGDITSSRTDPLLSDDSVLDSCDKTVFALLDELPLQKSNAPMAQIQMYTLASLARPRNIYEKMSTADLDNIANSLEVELTRHNEIPSQLKEYITMTIAELRFGSHALEAYIDDIYEIKFQTRRGWEDMSPPESVAAHLFFCERLAELFPIKNSNINSSIRKNRVFELVRFHDIGESITGDKRDQDKSVNDQKLERAIVERIAQIGALTGSSEFLGALEAFDEFEQMKKGQAIDRYSPAAFAADLDRLDLLIQYYRYYRENDTIIGEHGFKASISPEKFITPDMREKAARFRKYYESELSNRSIESPFNYKLWPTGSMNSKRIGSI